MQLIEWFSIVTETEETSPNSINQSQLNLRQPNLNIESNQKQFKVIFLHQNSNILFSSIIFDKEYFYLFGTVTLIDQKIKLYQTQLLKSILTRKCLTKNSIITKSQFMFHPITGEFSISPIHFNAPNILLTDFLIKEYIFTLLPQILYQIDLLYVQIISDLDYQKYKQCDSERSILESQGNIYQLKKYVIHSPFYAWRILTNVTSRLFCEQAYQQSRKYINSITIRNKTNTVTQCVHFAYNYQYEFIKQIILHNRQEDKYLNQKYLNQINKNNGNFITNINLNRQYLQLMLQNLEGRIRFSEGSIVVKIHKYPPHLLEDAKYQNQLLMKLPANQFLGIAKYFRISNLESEIDLIRITNLSNSLTFQKFIIMNSSTISIFTKLHIFTQIMLTLRYLRNSKIVYFNLIPSNIYIKKGQLTKLFDFTNSTHIDIPRSVQSKSKFPYVLNLQSQSYNAEKSQKSDIFSFACILYQTLYGKTPLDIKQSAYLHIQAHEFNKKNKYKVICPQKNEIYKFPLLKILLNFCLKSYTYENVNIKKDQERPYIDWGVIIMRQILTYSQKI